MQMNQTKVVDEGAEKKLTFADARGWVFKKSDNHPEEVLCAIGELATSIGKADITHITWVSTAFDKSDGGTLSATVTFNEKVTVSGTPTLSVTNGNQAQVLVEPTCSFICKWFINQQTYIQSCNRCCKCGTNAGDVLSFGANPLALNGGTIVDKSEGGNATITSASSIGTATGTITVTG